jgi:type IV pilus assembly protein PilC
LSLDISKYNQSSNPKPKVKEESAFWSAMNKDISFGGKKFNDKKKEQFYTDMSLLLQAGLDLNNALRLLDEENAKVKGINIFAILLADVLTGKPLSKSMEESGKFSNYEYQSIKIGEETGRLPIILTELKNHYEKKNALRQQFIGMITYPIIVIFIAFGVLIFLMNYVVPMFMSFLTQVNAELPWVTQFVLDMSEFVGAWYKPFLIFIVLIFLVVYFQKDQLWFKKISSSILLRLPLFGKMSQRIYLSRFSQAMTLLTSSRVPLTEALEMTKNMVDFYPLEVSITNVQKAVMKGVTLHKAMAEEKIFESRMVSLIRVGEEVNKLDEVFSKVSEQYSDNVESQTKVLKSVIEPLLLIIVGSVVALVALAMILPIFKMSSSMEF